MKKAPRRPRKPRPRLWRCPRCGQSFAHREQFHFCRSQRPFEDHFADKPPGLKLLFARLLEEVQACGPVTVLSEKTRIAFHARMSFMTVTVQRAALRGHFVLAERRNHPRFLRIDTISRANHVHHFRLTGSREINAEFVDWIRAAYAVGQQRHRRQHRANESRIKRPASSGWQSGREEFPCSAAIPAGQPEQAERRTH